MLKLYHVNGDMNRETHIIYNIYILIASSPSYCQWQLCLEAPAWCCNHVFPSTNSKIIAISGHDGKLSHCVRVWSAAWLGDKVWLGMINYALNKRVLSMPDGLVHIFQWPCTSSSTEICPVNKRLDDISLPSDLNKGNLTSGNNHQSQSQLNIIHVVVWLRSA